MKTYGTFHYKGHKLTLLVPPYVTDAVQAAILGKIPRSEARRKVLEWVADQNRLNRLHERLKRQTEAKGKAIVRILRRVGAG